MSANLDLVRSAYADWGRGVIPSEWHPDVELVRVDGPELGTWTGRDRVADALRGIEDQWEDFRRHEEEVRELDDNRVLVVHTRSGRGKASGLDIGQLDAGTKGATVVHIRDRKIARIVAYWDRDRALADLGLEE